MNADRTRKSLTNVARRDEPQIFATIRLAMRAPVVGGPRRVSGSTDQLQMARLKKRKLRLRDEIAMIEDQLIPDIIA